MILWVLNVARTQRYTFQTSTCVLPSKPVYQVAHQHTEFSPHLAACFKLKIASLKLQTLPRGKERTVRKESQALLAAQGEQRAMQTTLEFHMLAVCAARELHLSLGLEAMLSLGVHGQQAVPAEVLATRHLVQLLRPRQGCLDSQLQLPLQVALQVREVNQHFQVPRVRLSRRQLGKMAQMEPMEPTAQTPLRQSNCL